MTENKNFVMQKQKQFFLKIIKFFFCRLIFLNVFCKKKHVSSGSNSNNLQISCNWYQYKSNRIGWKWQQNVWGLKGGCELLFENKIKERIQLDKED